jgi:hypothetical protein
VAVHHCLEAAAVGEAVVFVAVVNLALGVADQAVGERVAVAAKQEARPAADGQCGRVVINRPVINGFPVVAEESPEREGIE